MLLGVPVVVLAHGGPRTIAAAALDPSRVALIAPDWAAIVACRIGAAMQHFVEHPPPQSSPNIDVPAQLWRLQEAVIAAAAEPGGRRDRRIT
jgi:hypothetical protein